MSENTRSRTRLAAVGLIAAAGCAASLATGTPAQAAAAGAPTITVSPASQAAKTGESVRWKVVTRGGNAPTKVYINYGDGGAEGTHDGGSFEVARRFNFCESRTKTFTQKFVVRDKYFQSDTATTTVKVSYTGPICQ